MTKRDWTAKERADLTRWRSGGETIAECARRLGRPFHAVAAACGRFGCRQPRLRTGDIHARLLKLYRKGYTDPDIGAMVGIRPQNVWFWRKRHGLPANRRSKLTDKKYLAHARRLDEEAGGIPFGTRWRMDDRIEGRDVYGWSVPVSRYERAYLGHLLGGPKTVRELAELTGRRPDTVQGACASMRRRGLLSGRRLCAGFGSSALVYSLAPGVSRRETA